MLKRLFFRWLGVGLLCLTGSATAEECTACAHAAQTFAAAEHFNGVVLVGRGGVPDFAEAFGVADVTRQTPLTTATRFDTGSISKWIAAIVVMRLVQQGELSLDEPITTYLPDYRHDTGGKLTLRLLMSHSSGVPNQIDEAIKRDPNTRNESLDNARAVKLYASGDLRFEPGSEWDYSHSNWLIVKAITEKVSQRTYAQLVEDFIVKPLGLHDTGTWTGPSSSVPGMAIGYSQLSPPTPIEKASPDFMIMAGGFYTSANDMLQLLDGLFSGKVLTPPTLATLLKVERPAQNYALGGRTRVMEIAGKKRTVAWEYGSNGAFRVLAWRVVDDGHTVIIMNNTSFDHMKIGALATELLEASYP
jgi:CubicO group peptidase (beta-lactamase class C family)